MTGVGWLDTLLLILTVIVAVVGAGTALRKPFRGMRAMTKKIDEFLEDWRGEAERPGKERQPGVMERLKTVEDRTAQLTPNGGAHLADQLARIERKLNEHLELHTPPGGMPRVDGEPPR